MAVVDKSGDDVGDKVILDQHDLILELELALLEPGNLQLVGSARKSQRIDCRVKIAVFYSQNLKPLAHFLVGHLPHLLLKLRTLHDQPRAGDISPDWGIHLFAG